MDEIEPIKLTEKQIACLRHLNANGGCYLDAPNCSRSVIGALHTIGFVTGGRGSRWHITIGGAKWLENRDRSAKPQ